MTKGESVFWRHDYDMKSVHESLILTTTGGLFSKAEVPMLYVQIQEHRAQLERSLSRQLTFEEAVHSWYENIYTPIIEAIRANRNLSRAICGMSLDEVYFSISYLAEEDGYNDIPKAVNDYAERFQLGLVDTILALLHLRKAGRQAS